MASNFPSSLDTFTNPSSSDAMDSVSVPHASQHSDLNDAVEALQAKVGADSSGVASSHDYKIAQLESGATGGKILQVVSTAKTDTFTTSSTSFTDVTGLSVSITPSATSSKILVMVTTNTSSEDAVVTNNMVQLVRDSTAIFIGDSAGSRIQTSFVGNSMPSDELNQTRAVALTYLDSPATTPATTYKVQAKVTHAGAVYINRAFTDADSAIQGRSASSITVMEISA